VEDDRSVSSVRYGDAECAGGEAGRGELEFGHVPDSSRDFVLPVIPVAHMWVIRDRVCRQSITCSCRDEGEGGIGGVAQEQYCRTQVNHGTCGLAVGDENPAWNPDVEGVFLVD